LHQEETRTLFQGFSLFGRKILFIGFFTTLFGIIIPDFVLIFIGLLVIGFLFYLSFRVNKIRSSLPDLICIESDGLTGSFVVGEEFTTELKLISKISWPVFLLKPKFGFFEDDAIELSQSYHAFRFSPLYAGEYKSDQLALSVSDPLGLVKRTTSIPFKIDLVFYPRVLKAALQALDFLYVSGFLGFGEQTSPILGGGLEYAGSRFYVEGDSVRFVDWKASARLGQLIVKDYYQEGVVTAAVFFEPDAPDLVSKDQLAAEFLETVMSVASLDWITDLHIAEGDDFTVARMLSPTIAVAVALRYVLKGQEKEFERFYDVLDPQPRRLFDRFYKISSKLTSIKKIGLEADIDIRLIVSSLTGDISRLIGLLRFTDSLNAVIQPTTPWKYITDFSCSYQMLVQYNRFEKIFISIGVPIELSFSEAYSQFKNRIRNLQQIEN
jgi:hypothetical protein